ncbi:MAG: flagellar brake protein [Nitrospinae bacterium]|nr:flagellar brake protein [Nitrospinota bacterium]
MKLLDLFKKDKEPDELKALSSDDLITPGQMRTNLEDVCKRKATLITTIDERPGTFRSMLLEVANESNFVIIDALMPKHGNQLIESSKKVRLDYSLEGVMYNFDTRFMGTMGGKFPSIKVAFPSIIKKIQKRKSFRITPPVDNPIIVEITRGITEKAADISEGGLSFYTYHPEGRFAMGMVLERVIFKLPTIDRVITAKAVVRSFTNGSSAKNRCGIEFIGMGMADKDSIANYCLVRQVESIRKKAN